MSSGSSVISGLYQCLPGKAITQLVLCVFSRKTLFPISQNALNRRIVRWKTQIFRSAAFYLKMFFPLGSRKLFRTVATISKFLSVSRLPWLQGEKPRLSTYYTHRFTPSSTLGNVFFFFLILTRILCVSPYLSLFFLVFK